jgi:hypothetical protein
VRDLPRLLGRGWKAMHFAVGQMFVPTCQRYCTEEHQSTHASHKPQHAQIRSSPERMSPRPGNWGHDTLDSQRANETYVRPGCYLYDIRAAELRVVRLEDDRSDWSRWCRGFSGDVELVRRI